MKQAFKPYEYCASRLEQRGWNPPTREYVDNLVEALRMSGVEAIVHSAVSQDCQALFPSTVFPHCHPEANFEAFHYLIGRLHGIGRPVLSWHALNHSSSVLKAHPDWRMIPLQGEGIPAISPGAVDHGVCINSPYRDLLPAFCQEVVRDVGFDGMWFDGSAFATHSNQIPGCLCAFCRDRFRQDTGGTLPEKVDWDSADFRTWVNWRYTCLMAFWQRLVTAIHAVKPEATVCFNNYRRFGSGGWTTGIPLRPLGWDVVMSGELDLQVFHGDFQMKMHRAYGCARGQDSWKALCDDFNLWVPDVERVPVEQAAVACAAAGGVMWMGSATDPRLVPETYAAAQETTGPLMPYRDGTPVEYAAIWVSQQTQDFYGRTQAAPSWEAWHGANELCLQAHVPSSVVFDEQVAAERRLDPYPVLLAGNAACLSRAQARELQRYVEAGGLLLACHDIGVRDEMGQPYAEPILDAWLGIRGRTRGEANPTLELVDPALRQACGAWVSQYKSGHTLTTPGEDAMLLASVTDHGWEPWDDRERGGDPKPRHPGLWSVKRGKGTVIYVGADLFLAHLRSPTTAHVRLFKALLTAVRPPAVSLEGPLQVTLNVRARDDGSWFVHLHNAPGTIWRYGGYRDSGELVSVQDLQLRIHGRQVRRAYSGLNGTPFRIAPDGDTVTIPSLYRNDVVVLRFVS